MQSRSGFRRFISIDITNPNNIPANVSPRLLLGSTDCRRWHFSAPLSSLTTNGILSGGLPAIFAIIAGTTYHYVAWAHINGTWYQGDIHACHNISCPRDSRQLSAAKVLRSIIPPPLQLTWTTDHAQQAALYTELLRRQRRLLVSVHLQIPLRIVGTVIPTPQRTRPSTQMGYFAQCNYYRSHGWYDILLPPCIGRFS